MPSSRRPVLLEHALLEPLLACLGVRVEHPVLVVVEDGAHSAPELRVGALEPDVDLAATREADLEGVVVRDAVMDQVGRGAGEDLLRALGNIGLDAATRDGADVAAALGDEVLRAGLAGCRAERADHRRNRGLLAGSGCSVDRVEDRAFHAI